MKTAVARSLSLALVIALSAASTSTGFAASTSGRGSAASSGGTSSGNGNRPDTLDTEVGPNSGDCRGNTCVPRHRLPHAAPCGSQRYEGSASDVRVDCRREPRT